MLCIYIRCRGRLYGIEISETRTKAVLKLPELLKLGTKATGLQFLARGAT